MLTHLDSTGSIVKKDNKSVASSSAAKDPSTLTGNSKGTPGNKKEKKLTSNYTSNFKDQLLQQMAAANQEAQAKSVIKTESKKKRK